MARRWRKSPKKGGVRYRLIAWLLLTAVVLIIADNRIRPIVRACAQQQAKLISSQTIHQAVLDELNREEISYRDIATLSRSSTGEITAIETDTIRLNHLKTSVVMAVQTAMTGIQIREVSIPLGNLFGNEFLAGRGPGIPLNITLSGSIHSEYKSEFFSAGINQTLHRITLHVSTDVYVMIPGCRTSTVIEDSFVVAETVIAGTVPDAFTSVNEDNNDIPSIIMDYGAQLP